MRILILGDGPTDLGRFDNDGKPVYEGVLPIFVRRLLQEKSPGVDVEFRVRKLAIKVTKKPSQILKESKHGYLSQLQQFLALNIGRWADTFVVVVDRDEKKYHKRIDALNDSRAFLAGKNKLCAVGMAIEELEAWLLADEKALRAALDDNSIQRQPDPEKLSSRDENSDRNPKGRLERVIAKSLNRSPRKVDYPELYAAIARAADFEQVAIRCPQGFQPFVEQVCGLLAD